MLRVFLLLIVLCLAVPTIPAHAEGLVGTVRVEAEDKGDSVDFKDGDRDAPVLQGQTAQIELSPPTWITGKVFSNDEMMMYSFYVIAPFKKEWRWEIPSRRIKITLKPTVVRYWKGYKPDGPCDVICSPMGEGKFKFQHDKRADGPHGYLELIGKTKSGFPKYRFWFDDESGTSESNSTDKTEPETGKSTSESAGKTESKSGDKDAESD